MIHNHTFYSRLYVTSVNKSKKSARFQKPLCVLLKQGIPNHIGFINFKKVQVFYNVSLHTSIRSYLCSKFFSNQTAVQANANYNGNT